MAKEIIRIKKEDLPKRRDAFAVCARERQHVAGGGHGNASWYDRRANATEVEESIQTNQANGFDQTSETLRCIRVWSEDPSIVSRLVAIGFLRAELEDPYYISEEQQVQIEIQQIKRWLLELENKNELQ